MAVQYANHKFFLPALSPLLYNAGIILGGVLLRERLGIEGFAWGVLGGAIVGNVLVQLPGALRVGMRYRPRVDPLDPDLIQYVKITVPLIAGLGMTFSNEVFFRFFSSFLSQGATASVNYALRTMMFVVALFGQASGVAFYPYLSRLAAERAFEKMTSLLNGMLNNMALYLIPLSALMMVLSPQVIAVLYQHGKFTSQSTANTAPVLSIYLLGAFASSASIIVTRSFYAMQKTLLPMLVSTVVSLVSIPLYIFFSRAWGAPGIALAATAGVTLQFLIMYSLWCRSFGGFAAAREGLVRLGKVIAIALAASLLCFLIRKFASGIDLGGSSKLNALVISVVAATPSLALVFVLYEFAGMQKMRDSVARLLRRRGSAA
jgi:putative peptidoglycan lipid II flippase